MIGATTLDEYRKHVEKDAALERRFQPVPIREPTIEDTISILRRLKERYEVHHGVRIKDAALIAAAKLSHRYIVDRFLPDKAIDLVDEGAARFRTEIDSLPEELDEISRKVLQLEMFAEIFDGFSIWSNDLTQLILGVDLDSEIVAHIFDERNQAVKSMIVSVIAAAKRTRRKIGICGQAPSDYQDFARFLVELGSDSISLNPDAALKTTVAVQDVEHLSRR